MIVLETFIRIGYWEHPVDVFRKRAAPTLRKLLDARRISRFTYLVHDRESGVPTRSAARYVHLRLWVPVNRDGPFELPEQFQMTRRVTREQLEVVAGVRLGALRRRHEDFWALLGQQSLWFLELLERHKGRPPNFQIVQFLHYFANMAQANVPL